MIFRHFLASVQSSRSLKRNLVFALGSLALYLWVKWTYPYCPEDYVVCTDGRIMKRSGFYCEPQCIDKPMETLQSRIIWNAPMHSWSGMAAEAVDFVVPLSELIPHLGLVGGYSADYVKEHSAYEIQKITTARSHISQIDLLEKLNSKSGMHQPDRSTIFVTQYDPGTYRNDLDIYRRFNFHYTIGRAMFETTGIPSGWVEATQLVDEIWVPSRWGKRRFEAAGVPHSKVHVIPEGINLQAFDREHVKQDEGLLPGSNTKFAFLSVFKWEARKNYEGLIAAFLQEFKNSENVVLYIRSGESDAQLTSYLTSAVHPRFGMVNNIIWVPHVAVEEYPKLFASADAFVLPSHGEGWCRPVMEAMAFGLPVIATNWGGVTDLATKDTAFLLDPTGFEPAYEQEPALINYDDQANHLWASISIEGLQKVMRYVTKQENRGIIKEVGERAHQRIAKLFSRSRVAQMVNDRLIRIQRKLARR